MRWLHTYLSMLGLAVVLFFSVTGITVNHPDWFYGGVETQNQVRGQIDVKWLQRPVSPGTAVPDDPGDPVDKLSVVEFLRSRHRVRGAVSSFTVDESECIVTFKGPGYAADAFIDRANGQYSLVEQYHGWVAVLNDLHKGRDTGPAWSVVIDASALLMIVATLSGMILLLCMQRRRAAGLLTGLVGTILAALIFLFWVP